MRKIVRFSNVFRFFIFSMWIEVKGAALEWCARNKGPIAGMHKHKRMHTFTLMYSICEQQWAQLRCCRLSASINSFRHGHCSRLAVQFNHHRKSHNANSLNLKCVPFASNYFERVPVAQASPHCHGLGENGARWIHVAACSVAEELTRSY